MKILSIMVLILGAIAVALSIPLAYLYLLQVGLAGPAGPNQALVQVLPNRLMPLWGPPILALAWVVALLRHWRGRFLQSILLNGVLLGAWYVLWYFGDHGFFGTY